MVSGSLLADILSVSVENQKGQSRLDTEEQHFHSLQWKHDMKIPISAVRPSNAHLAGLQRDLPNMSAALCLYLQRVRIQYGVVCLFYFTFAVKYNPVQLIAS